MSLLVETRHTLGSFSLDLSFESHGRFTAIFGASGSGKTSLVNVIAGLSQPAHARVVLDGVVLSDSAQGTNVPPHRRRIGYVFQDARLFPHLTVEGNLGYGQWFAPKAERYASKAQILELLGISHLLARRPRDGLVTKALLQPEVFRARCQGEDVGEHSRQLVVATEHVDHVGNLGQGGQARIGRNPADLGDGGVDREEPVIAVAGEIPEHLVTGPGGIA